MNDNSLRPVDTLVWITAVLAQESLNATRKIVEINRINAQNTKKMLDALDSINSSLLKLIDKMDK